MNNNQQGWMKTAKLLPVLLLIPVITAILLFSVRY
jgi:hypothetical protein